MNACALATQQQHVPAPAALARSKSSFLSAVAESWDSFGFDEHGRLSQPVLDSLMQNPKIHQKLAAEVATLDEMANDKGVTVKELSSYAAKQKADPDQNGYFDQQYDWYLSRAKTQSHALFAPGTPDPNAITQGDLGDCYVLSAISDESGEFSLSFDQFEKDFGTLDYQVSVR